ncbi:MAG: hypothetical protein LUG84_06765 [Akkermansiaceae bacterium]|nr:hypothetical protein [Akkermansiaceae bacterium]
MTDSSTSTASLTVAARLWRNGVMVFGALTLNPKAMSFSTASGNVAEELAKVPVASIAEVSKYNTYLFIPNGILILLKNGETLQLIISERTRLLRYLRALRPEL